MKRSMVSVIALCSMATAASAQSGGNWGGFYVGLHGGLGQSTASTTAVTASNFFPAGFDFGESSSHGFLGGAQAGYNFQSGAWVFGVEADISATNVTGRSVNNSPLLANRATTGESTQEWMGTVAAKIGYATGAWLIYGKAGWGWADYNNDSWSRNTVNNAVLAEATGGEVRDGYLLGLGAEYRMTRNWSVKAEYNFLDFGGDRVTRTNTAGGSVGFANIRDIETEVHAVKLGINYRF